MTYTEFTEETLPTSPSMYGLTETANGDLSSHSTMWRNPQGSPSLPTLAIFTVTRKESWVP